MRTLEEFHPPGAGRHLADEVPGIGHDAMFGAHAAITPFLRYSSGTAGNLKIGAVTIGAGLTWR